MSQINYYFALKVLLERMENNAVEQKEKEKTDDKLDPQEKKRKSKTPRSPRRVPREVN